MTLYTQVVDSPNRPVAGQRVGFLENGRTIDFYHGSQLTDADGMASLTYSESGPRTQYVYTETTDTTTSIVVDSNVASVTWVYRPQPALAPSATTAYVGTSVNLTVRITDYFGNLVPNFLAAAQVCGGPNGGRTFPLETRKRCHAIRVEGYCPVRRGRQTVP